MQHIPKCNHWLQILYDLPIRSVKLTGSLAFFDDFGGNVSEKFFPAAPDERIFQITLQRKSYFVSGAPAPWFRLDGTSGILFCN